ncbi:MAG: hypothetical protein HY692_01645, partial [Cyanobacteria bacterium NC_groundwater_1444_Ag_S-0.65um_54_12]|nr:hypothetical protein [Cyanobacteria bacterium NC_groundwater_1444_Ag_S-0.65um_54_12]
MLRWRWLVISAALHVLFFFATVHGPDFLRARVASRSKVPAPAPDAIIRLVALQTAKAAVPSREADSDIQYPDKARTLPSPTPRPLPLPTPVPRAQTLHQLPSPPPAPV